MDRHEHAENVAESTGAHQHDDPSGSILPNRTSHHSWFAYDAQTGTLLWQHSDADEHPTATGISAGHGSQTDIFANRYYKVLLGKDGSFRHVGESDWVDYKASMLRLFPIRWRTEHDSTLQAVYFERKRFDRVIETAKAKTLTNYEKRLRSALEHFVTTKPYEDQLSPQPNVLVATINTGLHVAHITNGRPLCTFTTSSSLLPTMIHDVDGDGEVERITASPGTRTEGRSFLTSPSILCG